MFTDFIVNGQGQGEVGEALAGMRYDPGFLRPYLDSRNRPSVTINTGKTKVVKDHKGREVRTPVFAPMLIANLRKRGMDHPTWNAVSMRRDMWVEIDRVVVKAARSRMRLWDDLSTSSRFGGFDAMAKLTLEYDAISDPGEAIVDMDGIVEGRTDSPLLKTRSIPLPITHSDFWFSERRLAVSRNSGVPLDTTMMEAAGRRVGEMIEKTAIGVETGLSYGTQTSVHDGTSKIYGMTNFPSRITKTDLTTPNGTNASAVIGDVIEMREALYAANFYGPFILYHTPAYDAWLDQDYILTGGNVATQTLRQRLTSIEGITDVRRLDFWTGGTYQMVLLQVTSDVARAIDGLPLTTVQWESQGGMRKNFKVMAIQVPQFRSDYNGDTGIIHGTTA